MGPLPVTLEIQVHSAGVGVRILCCSEKADRERVPRGDILSVGERRLAVGTFSSHLPAQRAFPFVSASEVYLSVFEIKRVWLRSPLPLALCSFLQTCIDLFLTVPPACL